MDGFERDSLNTSLLCKYFKEKNGKQWGVKQSESKSLMCVFGSDIYIWDQSDNSIIFSNLKNLSAQASAESVELKKEKDEETESSPQFQKLLVSCGISLQVENLKINRCGSHIVLWGSKGIKVVELPRRWGKNGVFEGGKEVISCRAHSIGENSIHGSSCSQLKQVSWHPGSKSDSHLAVLTSDNTFRIYNICEPDDPLSMVNVNTGVASFISSPGKSFVGAALGETAVAFDFGLPFHLKPKKRPYQRVDMSATLEVWPVYCVRGNGDILIVYSNLSSNRQLKLAVQGPVMMYPPAEDNYGVDACSILCLPTPVPVVVVSTSEGNLHHCVQLPGESGDNTILYEGSSPTKDSVSPLFEDIPEPTFFVIETAQLELCLSVPGLDDFEDDLMHPVHLTKDPCCNDRYHCSHASGVHSVALPWLNLVQQYFLTDIGDFNLPEEKECVVEHLVCTKPLHSCPSAPVLGLDVLTDLTLGAHLLVLSSDYDLTAIPIGMQYNGGSIGDDSKSSHGQKKLQSKRRDLPFSQRIAQILQRKISHPLLKSNSSTELSQQDCFQLLNRATQVLREEYVQRQDHARQEIDARISLLREHKQHQLDDLRRLVQERPVLREGAHALADKIETAKETHLSLTKRLEGIIQRLQLSKSTLSEAEKQMIRELSKIKDNMQLYTQNIEQVRLKQEYQSRQLSKSSTGSPAVLQQKQLAQIHNVLKEESDDIQDLKNDIRMLTISLG